MKRISFYFLLALLHAIAICSCSDVDTLEAKLSSLEAKVAELEEAAGVINSNAQALHSLIGKDVLVVGISETGQGYVLELSDGTTVSIIDGESLPSITPLLSIDAYGQWVVSFDGGKEYYPIEGAANAFQDAGVTPQIMIDSLGFWLISTDGGATWNRITGKDGQHLSATDPGQTAGRISFFSDVKYDAANGVFSLTLKDGRTISVTVLDSFYIKVNGFSDGVLISPGQTRTYNAEMSRISKAFFQTPEGWHAELSDNELSVTAPMNAETGEYVVKLVYTSSEGYLRMLDLVFTLTAQVKDYGCQLFNDFASGSSENILLDFSYAGYKHGETAPADVYSLGYKVYDVTDYGAIPDDGKSDREAFLKCVEAATGAEFESKNGYILLTKSIANAIIYFPEGEFILHTSDDDYEENGRKLSRHIQIAAGNFVIKGAGRDKTAIVMADPNHPADETELYSSPSMLVLKHNSGLSKLTDVTANAGKGTFSVTVADPSRLSEGSWVCLTMKNNDPACIADELAPYSALDWMQDIRNNGVYVYDYHQIRSIDGNVVTFHEPIMHEVDLKYTSFTGSSYNWRIDKYPHYENVGVEDLTFKGYAKSDFIHHGSWEDDGAYKPLTMTRLTNSWLRRVRFTSVSEACSVTRSANVSVYDVIIDGNRGHSAIRSQQSSRVFIGAVRDVTSDKSGKTGQYHGVGVSKPSMGAVLWRNEYGNDSCFESHSNQPRATLIDCCYGGWLKSHQGGDEKQAPNHLNDLTIWNYRSQTAASGVFDFWSHTSYWWQLMPPIIVGFHGEPTSFDQSQVVIDYSNGTAVSPESLYEAQLMLRLGAVPSWLNELK